jgi:hypothetical protein
MASLSVQNKTIARVNKKIIISPVKGNKEVQA